MQKIVIIILTSGICSCGSLPPDGSLDRMKQDQRMQLTQHCRISPDRYGFPYTREEYMNARFHVGRWVPDLSEYCFRLSSALVK